uniref:Neurotransmitter-gated ion-channel ligand-binding domain-containing protein n=1 Tax=Branchiostoma floridae TaxID=7739 RepID=C3Y2B6_BRAFL|eukprot:XP_002609996.1 hypothetical protein BRAFLDRAFT_105432 [Branchiostoma floridae]
MASAAGFPPSVLWVVRLSVMNEILSASGEKQNVVDTQWNMTAAIETLLHGYDLRVRPNVTGAAVRIGVLVDLIGIDDISELDMVGVIHFLMFMISIHRSQYTVTYDILQSWVDERLDFRHIYDGEKIAFLGEDTLKLWRPDTFIKNGQGSRFHDVTKGQQIMHVFRDGRVLYKLRLTTIASCWMKMHLFPFDTQNCTLLFETYGYTTSDIVYYWYRGRQSVRGFSKISLADFVIENFDFLATTSTYNTGIMTVVTITNIVAKVKSTLPRVSYIKAIDVYLGVCLVYVFSAVAEYAAVNHKYYTFALMQRRRKMGAMRKLRNRAGIHSFSESQESSVEMGEKGSSCDDDSDDGSDDVIDLTRTGKARRRSRGREFRDRNISEERIGRSEGEVTRNLDSEQDVTNISHDCGTGCCTDTDMSPGIENSSDEITRRAPHRYIIEIETLRPRLGRKRHRSSYHGYTEVDGDVGCVMTETGRRRVRRMSRDAGASPNRQGTLSQETVFYSWPRHKRQLLRQGTIRHAPDCGELRSTTNTRVEEEASSSEEDLQRISKNTKGPGDTGEHRQYQTEKKGQCGGSHRCAS